jgi:pSer/pThr/pTyr-binding forkhead associated (FHA) protein
MRVMVTHLTGARQGEREIFEEPTLTIGRSRECQVRLGLHDTRASTRHAELRLEKERYVLVDVGSTNGTFVNGKRGTRHKIGNGDVVAFGYGGPQLRFEFFEQLSSERPSIDEPHEFPFRSKFKWWLWGGAIGFAALTFLLAVVWSIVPAIPTALLAATLFFLGVAVARINITVGPDGIEHEAMFKTTQIPWNEVEALESGRGRTMVLTSMVCTIRGTNAEVSFAPRDYVEGHLLARMVAEVTEKEWQ